MFDSSKLSVTKLTDDIDWLNRDGNIFAHKNPQTGEVLSSENPIKKFHVEYFLFFKTKDNCSKQLKAEFD